MQLTVTFRNKQKKESFDIIVNEQQTIRNTIEIIGTSGIVDPRNLPIHTVQSMRTKSYLDCELSYEEQGIYYGDILEIKCKGE
ncbi:MAG: hypothetical protein R3Y54_10970 [Eubacteriales bacterium]